MPPKIHIRVIWKNGSKAVQMILEEEPQEFTYKGSITGISIYIFQFHVYYSGSQHIECLLCVKHNAKYCSCFIFIELSYQPHEVWTGIIPILYMRNLRLRK